MGKSEKKSNNSMTLQWAIPTVFLLVYLVVTLVNYNTTMHENARTKALDRVSRQAVSIAGYYNGFFYSAVNTADAVADSLLEEDNLFSKRAVGVIKQLDNHFGLEDAYIVATDGSAVDSFGNRYEMVDNSEEFQSLLGSKDSSAAMINERGAPVFMISAPIRTESEWRGNVVFVVRANGMSRIIDSTAYSYALIYANGIVGEVYGAESDVFKLGDNVNDIVEKITFEDNSKTGFIQSLAAGRSGTVRIATNKGLRRYLAFQPIGKTGLSVIVSIQDVQIDKSILDENKPTRNMMLKVLVSIGVFCGMIITIYIINRVSFAKESKELQNKAETDLLTDLLNKMSTESKIKEYLEGDGKDKTSMMCVLDIDNFKKINDTMGHAFGDEVLSTLGKKIRAEFRVTDIVGRTGGDEFIIFLKDLKDDAVIEREASRVARFFKNFTVGTYTRYSPTASIGAAIYPRDGYDYESMYKAADTALYKAKKRGKNQLAFYADATEEDKLEAEAANKPKPVDQQGRRD